MALFDTFSKKASEAGQTAIQKAKELSETARLNGLITDEEKSINNTYFQIGKLYATIHRNNPEPDFSGMINSVAEAESRIRDYKKQIQDIKGIQRCENCGAEVPRGAAFCSACGAVMPKIESVIPDDSVKCSNCGNIVKKGMRFCTSCGKPMETDSSTTSILVTEQEVAEPTLGEPEGVEAKVVERVCPSCGTKIVDDSAFCTECGTKL